MARYGPTRRRWRPAQPPLIRRTFGESARSERARPRLAGWRASAHGDHLASVGSSAWRDSGGRCASQFIERGERLAPPGAGVFEGLAQIRLLGGVEVEPKGLAHLAKLRPRDDDFLRHAVLVDDDFLLDGDHGATVAPLAGGVGTSPGERSARWQGAWTSNNWRMLASV